MVVVSLNCNSPAPQTPPPTKGLTQMRAAIVYSEHYAIALAGLESLHSFDIHKYKKIYERLIADGLLEAGDAFEPGEISREELLRVHTPKYLQRLKSSAAVAEFLEFAPLAALPSKLLDSGVLLPFRYATAGTLLAAREALDCGIAVNLGGGYHHAMPESGEGFCVYADIPVAIAALRAEQGKKLGKVLVIDLDVHQGNGTAVCMAGDANTFTFSMHQGDIYPIPKATSNLDVELPAGTTDEAYLAKLSKHLPGLTQPDDPDLVFYVAGCDTLGSDPLAGLKMTQGGIIRRDAMVVDACVRRRIPVVMVLGGGYSPNAWAAQYASVRRIIEANGLASARGR